jgi:hypothetical protein
MCKALALVPVALKSTPIHHGRKGTENQQLNGSKIYAETNNEGEGVIYAPFLIPKKHCVFLFSPSPSPV